MHLRDYVRFARRWVPPALVLAILFGGLTYALTARLIHKQYVSSVMMEVELGTPTNGTIDPNSAAAYATTESTVANQPNMVRQAKAQAALTVPPADSAQGVDNVTCAPMGNTTLFSCSVTSRSPVFAAAVANDLARVFIATENAWQESRYSQVLRYIQDQIARAKRSGNTTAVNVLEPIYPQVQLALAQQSNLARLVTPAAVPTAPSGPHPLLNAGIAFALIALVVLSLGRVVASFDDSVQGEDEIKALTGLPIVGLIPTVGELRGKPLSGKTLQVRESPHSPGAEAYRATRTGIAFATAGKQASVLLFTSAVPGEGKSTVALNVAASFADAGKRVILVDLDLWHRAISRVFDPAGRGVTNLLIEDHPHPSSYLVPSGVPNLQILPTGPIPPNLAELLGSARMAWIMQELRAMADLVVVDSPALLAVTDGAIAATLCDEVVLVVRPNSSRRRSVVRAIEMLRLAGVSVVGVVVNSFGKRDADSYFDYRASARQGRRESAGSADRGAMAASTEAAER